MNYLSAGTGKLQLAMKDLRVRWHELRQTWADPVADQFEQEHIELIEDASRRLLSQVNRLSDVMEKIARQVNDED